MSTSAWKALFGAPRIEVTAPLDRLVLPRARTPLRVTVAGAGRLSVGGLRRWFWRKLTATFLVPADCDVTIQVIGVGGRTSRVARVASTATGALDGPSAPAVTTAALLATVRVPAKGVRGRAVRPILAVPLPRVAPVPPPRLATARIAARATIPQPAGGAA